MDVISPFINAICCKYEWNMMMKEGLQLFKSWLLSFQLNTIKRELLSSY